MEGEEEIPNKKRDTQCISFIVGMCKFWEVPIHVRLKELLNKYGLTWLPFTMCYTKFSNLWEMFQGNMGQKLMKGIVSCNFMDLPCNCNAALKLNKWEVHVQWRVQGNVPSVSGKMHYLQRDLYWEYTTENDI